MIRVASIGWMGVVSVLACGPVLGCQLDTTPAALGGSPSYRAIAGAPAVPPMAVALTPAAEDSDSLPAAEQSPAGAATPPAAVTPADDDPAVPASGSGSTTPAPDELPASSEPSADVGAPVPLPIHRYSFDGDGNAVRDSIG